MTLIELLLFSGDSDYSVNNKYTDTDTDTHTHTHTHTSMHKHTHAQSEGASYLSVEVDNIQFSVTIYHSIRCRDTGSEQRVG